jgi:hypothetical protein
LLSYNEVTGYVAALFAAELLKFEKLMVTEKAVQICLWSLMWTVKRSLRKNKIKDKNIQELWSSFDVGPSRHLS